MFQIGRGMLFRLVFYIDCSGRCVGMDLKIVTLKSEGTVTRLLQ